MNVPPTGCAGGLGSSVSSGLFLGFCIKPELLPGYYQTATELLLSTNQTKVLMKTESLLCIVISRVSDIFLIFQENRLSCTTELITSFFWCAVIGVSQGDEHPLCQNLAVVTM